MIVRSSQTVGRTIAKASALIILFPIISGMAFLVTVIYGLIVTMALLFLYGLLIGFLTLLFSAIHLWSSTASPSNIGDLVYIALFIDFALIAALVLMMVGVFVSCPLQLKKTLQLGSIEKGASSMTKIAELSKRVSASLSEVPFSHLIPSGNYNVGGLSFGNAKVLVADPSLVDILTEKEISAVLAHEYAHFSEGMSISYAFLRRCLVAAHFLDFEIRSGGDKTFFSRAIRFTTWPLPDLMKKQFRGLFFHIARVMNRTCSLLTKSATRMSRREFYDAEFFADQRAVDCFGYDPLVTGLVKVSFLQVMASDPSEKARHPSESKHTENRAGNSGKQDSLDVSGPFEKLWKDRCVAFEKSTSTHPSISVRILKLEKAAVQMDYKCLLQDFFERVESTGTQTSARPEKPQTDPTVFMQALCYPHFDSGAGF